MKGDLHGRSLFSLYSRILHPARMHFGPFLNLPARTRALPKSPPDHRATWTGRCQAHMLGPCPGPLAILLPSIPSSCYLCAINSNDVYHACPGPVNANYFFMPPRLPSKGSAGFAQRPDRSKCQPCFAAPSSPCRWRGGGRAVIAADRVGRGGNSW